MGDEVDLSAFGVDPAAEKVWLSARIFVPIPGEARGDNEVLKGVAARFAHEKARERGVKIADEPYSTKTIGTWPDNPVWVELKFEILEGE